MILVEAAAVVHKLIGQVFEGVSQLFEAESCLARDPPAHLATGVCGWALMEGSRAERGAGVRFQGLCFHDREVLVRGGGIVFAGTQGVDSFPAGQTERGIFLLCCDEAHEQSHPG